MNPATQGGLFFAAVILALKSIYELVLLVKKQSNGKVQTGVYCNYPLQGGCAFTSRDFHQMRKVEIVEGVASELREPLDKQNDLLVEIRDGVRDLRPLHGR